MSDSGPVIRWNRQFGESVGGSLVGTMHVPMAWTEGVFLACADPALLLAFYRGQGVADRKLLQFIAACRSVSNGYGDGNAWATVPARGRACHVAGLWLEHQEYMYGVTVPERIALLRHVCGNPWTVHDGPFRKKTLGQPHCYINEILISDTVRDLATFLASGEGDCTTRFRLADALEERGHVEPLALHFRSEPTCPKGCWALDLILGRE